MSCVENSVDPGHLAFTADLDPHCLPVSLYQVSYCLYGYQQSKGYAGFIGQVHYGIKFCYFYTPYILFTGNTASARSYSLLIRKEGCMAMYTYICKCIGYLCLSACLYSDLEKCVDIPARIIR